MLFRSYGKWLDAVIMRVGDAFMAIPTILFMLVVMAIVGPGITTLIFVIGVTNWVPFTRVVRSEVLSIKERDFVHADTGTLGVSQGVAFASADPLIIKVFGKGGHAARPHEGIDAIAVSAQVITALQNIVSRMVDPLEAGADMKNGLRINGEKFSRLYTNEIELSAGGVAFYDGKSESAPDVEMRKWIEAIANAQEPVVTPKQALVVSQILEALYESARTGKAVYLNNASEA